MSLGLFVAFVVLGMLLFDHPPEHLGDGIMIILGAVVFFPLGLSFALLTVALAQGAGIIFARRKS